MSQDNISEAIAQMGKQARAAALAMARKGSDAKDKALAHMAQLLTDRRAEIAEANAKDLAAAESNGLSGAKLDRLRLSEKVLDDLVQGLQDVSALPDPVGEVTRMWTRPNGLQVGKMRIPLGVIGIIYESRPNVTADAAALCLRSGNVVFLRGGSEAAHSNGAILNVLRGALEASGLPADCLMSLPSTDRAWVLAMMQADQYLDLIIPRGGERLIRFVTENSRVPVIQHYKGVCHVYVDRAADLEQAYAIAMNAKVQRPGVCNAMETLLVHEGIAASFLPEIARQLRAAGVELRGCDKTAAIIEVAKASEDDYYAEFLDLVLAIRVVPDMDAAMAHIAQYGSDHTEAIVSEDYSAVRRFLDTVQSSVVVANASTRFADGGQLGLGAEIGISTSRLHAYGPMGADDLTTLKFVIQGSGQTRE